MDLLFRPGKPVPQDIGKGEDLQPPALYEGFFRIGQSQQLAFNGLTDNFQQTVLNSTARLPLQHSGFSEGLQLDLQSRCAKAL